MTGTPGAAIPRCGTEPPCEYHLTFMTALPRLKRGEQKGLP